MLEEMLEQKGNNILKRIINQQAKQIESSVINKCFYFFLHAIEKQRAGIIDVTWSLLLILPSAQQCKHNLTIPEIQYPSSPTRLTTAVKT